MSLYDSEHKDLINKLKGARAETCISQEDVAQKLGRTQSFISKLENGQIKVDALLLKQLTKIYRKDFKYFLDQSHE